MLHSPNIHIDYILAFYSCKAYSGIFKRFLAEQTPLPKTFKNGIMKTTLACYEFWGLKKSINLLKCFGKGNNI